MRFNVGDDDPLEEDDGTFCEANWMGMFFCTRSLNHEPPHYAGNGLKIVEVWNDDSVVCEYPEKRGGCNQAAQVDIKHNVLSEEGEIIETKVIGRLCQSHGMELFVHQMGGTTPSAN